MTQESDEDKIDYRLAGRDDETDILAVLKEVASEVPVQLDGPEREAKIQTEIVQCHQNKKSWVAVDAVGKSSVLCLRDRILMKVKPPFIFPIPE